MSEGNRIKLALLFGGRSAEHEISVISARSVSAALDPDKYELIPVYISRQGRWYLWPEFADEGSVVPIGEDGLFFPVADPERKSFLVSNQGVK